jgi:hypothetical protein
VLEAHSQRREEILAKADQLGIDTPAGLREVSKRTRDDKVVVEDHDGLKQTWIEKTEGLGYDAAAVVEQARGRAIKPERPMSLSGLRAGIDGTLGVIKLYLRPNDPLTSNGLARIGLLPREIRTEMAVASAIRILGQNEATFQHAQIAKTALDLGLSGVTIEGVEARMAVLKERGSWLKARARAWTAWSPR